MRNRGNGPGGRRLALAGRAVQCGRRQPRRSRTARHRLLQFKQSIAETGIVDAQPLTQGGSRQRHRGREKSGAHSLGERRRCAAWPSRRRASGWWPPPCRRSRTGSGAGAKRCSTVSISARRHGAPSNRPNRSRRTGPRSRAALGRGYAETAWRVMDSRLIELTVRSSLRRPHRASTAPHGVSKTPSGSSIANCMSCSVPSRLLKAPRRQEHIALFQVQ